jgi:hypothetical protein
MGVELSKYLLEEEGGMNVGIVGGKEEGKKKVRERVMQERGEPY